MSTLWVDIGGTSIKLLVIDEQGEPVSDRKSQPTPSPANPEAVMKLIHYMAEIMPLHQRISVGFPGIVRNGVAYNAPNLGDDRWRGVRVDERLAEILERPVRVLNDADLQGLGVVQGEGVEMVVTLGTGMGTALFTGGRLVPNLELGHHPFRDGKTYEDLVRDSELKRIGPAEWTARVLDAIGQIEPIFNYDVLHVGGGNTRHLQAPLPANARLFSLEDTVRGALKLWQDA